MSYRLLFKIAARKEWDKLDATVREIFKRRLAERLKKPHNESSRLSGMKNCYKIKLRQAGYRLVYQVREKKLVVVVSSSTWLHQLQFLKAQILEEINRESGDAVIEDIKFRIGTF